VLLRRVRHLLGRRGRRYHHVQQRRLTAPRGTRRPVQLVVIDGLGHWSYDGEITVCGIALADVPSDRMERASEAPRMCDWCAESVGDDDEEDGSA
jgi:hypothetical protein